MNTRQHFPCLEIRFNHQVERVPPEQRPPSTRQGPTRQQPSRPLATSSAFRLGWRELNTHSNRRRQRRKDPLAWRRWWWRHTEVLNTILFVLIGMVVGRLALFLLTGK